MNKHTLSRRTMLKGGAVAAGISALGLHNLFGISRAFAQDMSGENDDVQTVLNLAATAELFASTHYLAAINGDLGLAQTQIDYLKAGFLSERDHYDLLLSLGAEPVVTEFYVPETLFSDRALFAQITEVAETAFTAAYLAATRIFTEGGAPEFAVTAAQISAVEAEHRALARQIGGLLPNNISYTQYQLMNVSDAVPVLQPFLDGSGEGFVGPVSPPTEDEVAAVRAEAGMLGYDGAVMPYAAMQQSASSSQTTASDSGSTTVTVTTRGANVNIRSGAGTDFEVIGVLRRNSSAEIDAQRMGTDGIVWWRLVSGGWVRSDTVDEPADARSLPEV